MLDNAQGTSFEKVDTSLVSIGTIVTLRDADTSEEEPYTILGAWDGDPDRHIISYQTAIGQALLGKKRGDRVTVNTDHGSATYEVVAFEPAPVDVAPAPVEGHGVAQGAGLSGGILG